MEKLDILPSFQDILTKIGGHLGLRLSARLASVKFYSCFCQLVNFFTDKFKLNILVILQEFFTKVGGHLQGWLM